MAGFSVVASRYAQSILGLAIEKNLMDVVNNDLKSIASAIRESDDLRAFMKSPIIQINTKKAVLKKAFASVNEFTLLFIEKLCDARRESLLVEIADAYETNYKTRKGIITAEITSASPISDKVREDIKTMIQKNPEFQKATNIELKETVNAALIGGIIVKVEDKQIDASFSRKLAELRNAFDDNLYVKEY